MVMPPCWKAAAKFLDFGAELKDFDTAALISNLTSLSRWRSSVVDLAGAMAKPVWILLTFLPDWRRVA